MLYEALLLVGVLAACVVLPLALLMASGVVLPGPLLGTYVFLVLGVYFVWHWSHGRQTLAMKTWKVKLVDNADAPPNQNQLLLRYALSWPSLLFFGAGLLWALFDKDHQFLHDRLAGTRVVSAVPPTTASNPPPAGK
jgi:uncharacterized RDD family membrane protein YckC